MRLLLLFGLGLLAAAGLSPRATATEPPVPGCGLANSYFCGVWLPAGKGAEGAGPLTIRATGWTWENGDKADCQLLDQGDQENRHYATFQCTIRWQPNGKEEQQFVRLYSDPLDHPEQSSSSYSAHPGIHMSGAQKLDCLLDGWNEMLEDKNSIFIKMRPKSKCGRVTTYSYVKQCSHNGKIIYFNKYTQSRYP